MAIQRVTEAEVVEVGRYYLVPCARVLRTTGHDFGWLPVNGPAHEDREILGFPSMHYHYDWRFMPLRSARRILARLHVVFDEDIAGSAHGFIEGAEHVVCVEWRRMLCRRVMPEFPFAEWRRRIATELEAAFADRRIKPDCRICPHRGIPLNGLPSKDNVVVCPGHGLSWHTITGQLVRRGHLLPL